MTAFDANVKQKQKVLKQQAEHLAFFHFDLGLAVYMQMYV